MNPFEKEKQKLRDDLGNAIKAKRIQKGKSLREMAEYLGLRCPSHVASMESGDFVVSCWSLHRLEKILGPIWGGERYAALNDKYTEALTEVERRGSLLKQIGLELDKLS